MAAERMLCEPLPRPSWLIEWVGFFAPPEAPPWDLPAVDVRDFLAISPDDVLSARGGGAKSTKPSEGGEIGEKWSALEYLKILVLELKIKL